MIFTEQLPNYQISQNFSLNKSTSKNGHFNTDITSHIVTVLLFESLNRVNFERLQILPTTTI